MKKSTSLTLFFLTAFCLISSTSSPAQDGHLLYPVVEGGKYGYIDRSGRVVIETQFDDAKRFSEGLARVRVGAKWGFIDRGGAFVIRPQYDPGPEGMSEVNSTYLDFHEGRAAVFSRIKNKWGYIDRSGSIVIEQKYDIVSRFSEGLASVGHTYAESHGNENYIFIGGHRCYINSTGEIIPLRAVGETFSEGLAVASSSPEQQGSPEGYIDHKGNFLIAPQKWYPYAFSEGAARVRAANTEDWGFIDSSGKIITGMRYGMAGDFHEGLARVGVGIDQRVGFLDKVGRLVIKASYLAAGNFSEGVAAACIKSEEADSMLGIRCGYIDHAGAWMIPPTFGFMVGDYRGGLALAATSEEWGYIDKTGGFVWRHKFRSGEKVIWNSIMTGCSVMSEDDYNNYPCEVKFRLF